MKNKFDIGLSSKINKFCDKFSLLNLSKSENTDLLFEDFANYVIASNLSEEELTNLKSVSTNKAQDIDGIAIIINDTLITEESDLEKIGKNEKIKLKIAFIQSTTQKSCDKSKLNTFVDGIINFLLEVRQIEPFSSIYHKLMDEEGAYIDLLDDTPLVYGYFVYGVSSHIITEDEISALKNKITSRTELRNIIKLGDIYIYYAEQLKDKYDAIDGFNYAEIKLDKNVQLSPVDKIDFSILSTIKFAELKKILLTKDGKLKEQIFVENIRSFIGNTGVNQNIRETLDDNKTSIYFSFLNNGITIMCDSINKHPVKENTFKLMHPRIINGCQTTHILFDKFKENAENIDNIDIVAKIIATKDNELKKKIVLAANNQNSIDQDLQALNSFHEHIENYFIGNSSFSQKLYFERLRGQYSDVVPPHSKIGIETLARVYISVFMREPHKMKTNALTKIEEYQKDKKIFVETTPAEDYYLCAILYYYLQSFILNNALTLKTKTIDMHLLMVCNIVMEKKGMTNTTKKISYLSNKDNALSLFNIANNRLNKQSELFEKRGLYSSPKTHRLLEDIKTEEIDDAIE